MLREADKDMPIVREIASLKKRRTTANRKWPNLTKMLLAWARVHIEFYNEWADRKKVSPDKIRKYIADLAGYRYPRGDWEKGYMAKVELYALGTQAKPFLLKALHDPENSGIMEVVKDLVERIRKAEWLCIIEYPEP